MLSGDPPQIITETTIGHNLQVWKVREYNLYSSTSSTGLSDDAVLPAGDVLSAFFPTPTLIQEDAHHAVFTHSSQERIYHRPHQETDDINSLDQEILRDVIIIGEVRLSNVSIRFTFIFYPPFPYRDILPGVISAFEVG